MMRFWISKCRSIESTGNEQCGQDLAKGARNWKRDHGNREKGREVKKGTWDLHNGSRKKKGAGRVTGEVGTANRQPMIWKQTTYKLLRFRSFSEQNKNKFNNIQGGP